jgi:sigma-E factor negative regulatory protein RseA
MVMEKVSALMDGELDGGDAERQITRLKHEGDLKYGWETWHLIGDAMRGESPLSSGFNQELAQRLAQEPTVLAPQRRTVPRKLYAYVVSAAASVAGIALVGWVVMSTGTLPSAGPRVEVAKALEVAPAAPTPAPVTIAVAPQPEISVPSEGQSNEYLLAHQGISPSTAIQGVAPYIRTVSNLSPTAPAPR